MDEDSMRYSVDTVLIYETSNSNKWLAAPGYDSVLTKKYRGRYVIDIYIESIIEHGFKNIIIVPVIPDYIIQRSVIEWGKKAHIQYSRSPITNITDALRLWKNTLKSGFIAIDVRYFLEPGIMNKMISARSYVNVVAIFASMFLINNAQDTMGMLRAYIYGNKLVRFNDLDEVAGDYFLGMVMFREEAVTVIFKILETGVEKKCYCLPDLLMVLKEETIIYIQYSGQMKWANLRSDKYVNDMEHIFETLDIKRTRLKDAIKSHDGFVASLFAAPMANRFVGLVVNTAMRPNHITIISFVLALTTTLFFASGLWLFLILGGVLLQLSFILDCADGQLARYKNWGTDFGGWLDSIVDKLKEYAVYFGLAFGVWIINGDYKIWCIMFFASISLAYKHLDGYYRKSLQKEQGAVLGLGEVLATDQMSKFATRAKKNPLWYWIRVISSFGIGERMATISFFAIIGKPEYALALLVVGNFGSTFYNHTRNWQLYYMALEKDEHDKLLD